MAAYQLMCLSSLASQQRIDFAKEKSSFKAQELASYETHQWKWSAQIEQL